MIGIYEMLDQLKKITSFISQEETFPGLNLDNYE